MKKLFTAALVAFVVAQLVSPASAGFGIKGGSKAQNLAGGITWMQNLNQNWGIEAGAEFIASNPSLANGFIYGKYTFTRLGAMPFAVKAGFDVFSSTGSSSSSGWAGVELSNLINNPKLGFELGANLSGTSAITAQLFYLF